ncbi:hypothetical protein SteCoe_10247 [Stentor coeruleus]|uniref:Peptidase M14 domain-containing protein n=1 Tax=Stentor coeruleus TaxID=5963 RepID=A0A1R2CFZ6_9CILI|nr:hypothetical protein SteCoe_10247 [Stentor coeruleus]
MSVEYDFSSDESILITESNEIKRRILYRLEDEGILVYDTNARVSDEPILPAIKLKSTISPNKKNKKSRGLDYDTHQFQNISQYSPKKNFQQDYTLVIPSDTLRFSSKFESGNLKKAIKLNDNEYRLILEYDTETQGYTQWYYFSVKPYKAPHKVRFYITNLMKFESLYNDGMKPLTFSMKKMLNGHKTWERKCTEVSYYKNQYLRPNENKFFYTLTFAYTFDDPEDTIFFAYSYPYTYSDLLEYVETLQKKHPSILRVNNLCMTLAGNCCPIITITSKINSYTNWDEEMIKLEKSAAGRRIMRIRESRNNETNKTKHQDKKAVFVTARVHPGESNSSFMIKGFIDYLVSDYKDASLLRKKIIFKIIPMLNPDGVIYGNYRCSLLGVDLNRRWNKPHRLMHPTIYYSKKALQILSEENEVLLYCDMHGHSIKKDIFMYGCYNSGKEVLDIKKNVFIRLIPYVLSLKNDNFSFKNSKFRIEKGKISTARVVNFTEFNILSSFTLEASFYGCTNFPKNQDHLLTPQLEKLGRDLCNTLLIFTSPRELKKKLNDLTYKLSGKTSPPKSCTQERFEEEYIGTINDALQNIDGEMIEGFDIEDSDSGGSDFEGSDNDDKKVSFKKKTEKSDTDKKIRLQNTAKSISPIDIVSESLAPSTPKPLRFFRDMAPLKKYRFRDNQSSSAIKDRTKLTDEKPNDITENGIKLKPVLHPSSIMFTREKIPHDSSLINAVKISKKIVKKSQFFEKRNKLQIINTIKNKLNNIF